MADKQFYLAIAVPILSNAAVMSIAIFWVSATFDRIDAKFDVRLKHIEEAG